MGRMRAHACGRSRTHLHNVCGVVIGVHRDDARDGAAAAQPGCHCDLCGDAVGGGGRQRVRVSCGGSAPTTALQQPGG